MPVTRLGRQPRSNVGGATSTTLADFLETGFPNQLFCDSWVVGFWRADHEAHFIGLGGRSYTLVEAVPGPQHKARRRMCPLYVAGLIGPGDRKSVQPMAERLAPGDYDQLHHFVALDDLVCLSRHTP
jgi:hypothetical protein